MLHSSLICLGLSLMLAGCSACNNGEPPGQGGPDTGLARPGRDAGGPDAHVVPADCTTPSSDCPCPRSDVGKTITCFHGRPSQLNVGTCRAGMATCQADGFYSSCVGEVPPGPEICDGMDHDCDGVANNGVLSACGDCRGNCNQTRTPTTGPGRFMPGPMNSDGVSLNPNGDLVLNASSQRSYFAWIANSGEGTMSKLDSRTGKEVARYATIRPQDPHVSGMRLVPWNEPCLFPGENDNPPGAGNCGSRTAVDLRGDVWIANRAFNGQGTVTKVSNFIEACIDYNGNGRIDTSRDKNGNGVIDVPRDPATGGIRDIPATVVDDPNAEFLGPWDECILVTLPIGAPRSWPRALAIDSGEMDDGMGHHTQNAGNVWVGTFHDRPSSTHGRYYRIDADTYQVMASVVMPEGHHPYGAVINAQQILFSTHIDQGDLVAIDTRAQRIKIFPGEPANGDIPHPDPMCKAAYGIGIDGRGRVWQAGWTCRGAFRYDPSMPFGQRWTAITVPNEFGESRGIAADTEGGVWLAHSTDPGRITRIDADRAVVTGSAILTSTAPPQMAFGTIGAGIDFDNNIWAVNGSGSASKIIPRTCSFYQNPMSGTGTCTVLNYPVGVGPYTYSDFTGFALRNFTAPRGRYTIQIPGCMMGTEQTTWERLEWTATEPQGTAVEVRLKTANVPADFAGAMQLGPFRPSPVFLDAVPKSNYLEIEFTLRTDDRIRSPILHGYLVRFTCPMHF